MNTAERARSMRPQVRGWRIISVRNSPYQKTNRRRNACTAATRRNSVLSHAGYGRLRRGRNQLPVRWKTTSRSASSAISGTNCTALAPVPTTATRLPLRS
jgi:hypothetical protein